MTKFHSFILMVYRPEAVLDKDSVFSGIEILGIFGTEDQVNVEIDKYHNDHPDWKFSYETVTL